MSVDKEGKMYKEGEVKSMIKGLPSIIITIVTLPFVILWVLFKALLRLLP